MVPFDLVFQCTYSSPLKLCVVELVAQQLCSVVPMHMHVRIKMYTEAHTYRHTHMCTSYVRLLLVSVLLSLCVQLIQQDSTTAFGLMFLLTASEELATPREDLLTTSRRQELRTLLLKEMPAMLSILFGILNFHAEKHKQMLRATPPPSPHVSPVKPVGEVLLSGQPAEDFRPVDTLAEEVCSMCLKCLAHIFSWIPLDHLLTLAMLDTLFYFSFYGCHSENDCTDCSGTLGHLAIGCICELLQRSCMPSQLQTFLMHVFEKTFLILKRLTSESAQSSQPVSYASLDDRSAPPVHASLSGYSQCIEAHTHSCLFVRVSVCCRFLEKCNEYLRVLMSLHLKRVESSPHFPVAEFLSLFQRHTMKQVHTHILPLMFGVGIIPKFSWLT